MTFTIKNELEHMLIKIISILTVFISNEVIVNSTHLKLVFNKTLNNVKVNTIFQNLADNLYEHKSAKS